MRILLEQDAADVALDVTAAGQHLAMQYPLTSLQLLHERGSWRLVMRGEMLLPNKEVSIQAENTTVRQVLVDAAEQLGVGLELYRTFSDSLTDFDFEGSFTELRTILGLQRVQFLNSRLAIGTPPVRFTATATPLGSPFNLARHIEQAFVLDADITLYTRIADYGQPTGLVHSGDSHQGVMSTRCQFRK